MGRATPAPCPRLEPRCALCFTSPPGGCRGSRARTLGKMKTVILSPTEHADASNEEHTVYSLAEKNDGFTFLDQFFFATIATDLYPKDERWYRKRPATRDEIYERLRESGIKEVQSVENAE